MLGKSISVIWLLALAAIISRNTSAESKIGPFEFKSQDGNSSLRIQLIGQLKMEYENKDNDPSNERSDKVYMEARRLRLILSGILGSPDLTYRTHLSFAPKSLELMDLYLNYRFNDNLQFRAGQYKVPFTNYRMQSFSRLIYPDWAVVSKYFGGERQMGLMVHNGYTSPPEWAYAAGVFTGVNARASHGIGVPLVYNQDRPNPSDLANSASRADFHPELFLNLSYNANGINVKSNADKEGGGLRYSLGISGGWDIELTEHQDFSIRLAPELLVKYHGASFLVIGYAGFVDMGHPPLTRLGMTGLLLQAAYTINPRLDISIRYARVDFKSDLARDAYESTGKVLDREVEIGAGLNYEIIGGYLELQNDLTWYGHTRNGDTWKDISLRTQLQINI
nr:hypothetical protein [candidate division Zixibacteria bacterium]